ncbi:hypothetical protein L6164_012189 [Bauhinia variegata]|uniref:Uncharacterized protein n=1 Tax=Bauhinia variegata TaxID=167791 RepID=A0ACB9PAQ4_BAUVA|nr:hypothetical protein L6164_012189 [Bauhinia variegata]
MHIWSPRWRKSHLTPSEFEDFTSKSLLVKQTQNNNNHSTSMANARMQLLINGETLICKVKSLLSFLKARTIVGFASFMLTFLSYCPPSKYPLSGSQTFFQQYSFYSRFTQISIILNFSTLFLNNS